MKPSDRRLRSIRLEPGTDGIAFELRIRHAREHLLAGGSIEFVVPGTRADATATVERIFRALADCGAPEGEPTFRLREMKTMLVPLLRDAE